MTFKTLIDHHTCIFSVIACIFLTFSYVASLYVWRPSLNRDHPSTIKKRFFSVSCMMFVAPFFAQCFLTEETLKRGDIYEQLGLRSKGLLQASFLPLILTMVLFLGPLTMQYFSGTLKFYTEPLYWISSWQDLVWVRNHIMAPVSEEWVFRACMMPLLLQCLKPMTAVFIGPLLFGIAHFHHMFEQIKAGMPVNTAFLVSMFQFMYTSMFGAYSAFLFVRTGHLIAPLFAHMFCNHMGFPNFPEISQHQPLHQIVISSSFIIGLTLWCYLLSSMTNPIIYENSLHWQT